MARKIQLTLKGKRPTAGRFALGLIFAMGFGAALLSVALLGRVRPGRAASSCGADGCRAHPGSPLASKASAGNDHRPAINPEQAIAIAVPGEVGENDFRISHMMPLGDPHYIARAPAVAYNNVDNEYLVVWEGDDGGREMADEEYEIFGQRVDAGTGAEIGPDIRLSDMGPDGDAEYGTSFPGVVHNGAGKYLVVWEGDDDSGELVEYEYEILGQRYTPEPIPSGAAIFGDFPDPSLPGEPFTVTLAVTATQGTPTGVVTVTVNDNPQSCVVPLEDGSGGCPLTLFIPEDYTITATYNGYGGFTPSSASEGHTVIPAPGQPTTTSILTDEPDPTQAGEPFTVTVSVTATQGSPTGLVFVTAGIDPGFCAATLAGELGSCVLTPSVPGAYTLTAVYAGDGTFGTSLDTEVHTVVPAATTATILSDEPDPSEPGEPFTVTVSVTSTLGVPTGAVTVTVSGDPTTCSDTLSAGTGSCSLALSASGTYTLTAAYAGAGSFGPSSATEPHTVTTTGHELYLPVIRRD